MPEIDVTEVLIGSDIAATQFDVIRRRSHTDTNGIERHDNVVIPNLIGSVTPTGDNSLVRDEAYQLQNKTIMVVTKFFLRASAQDKDGFNWQPDLILWQGDYYIVKTVDDFSQFGPGMIVSECISFEYNNIPPYGNPPSVATGVLDFRKRNNSSLGGGH